MLVKDPKCKFNEGSNFDRTGQWVVAKYLDSGYVTGIVQDSRVKYGGKVQHSIVSDSPTFIYTGEGKGERVEELRNIGSTFLIEEQHVMIAQKEF